MKSQGQVAKAGNMTPFATVRRDKVVCNWSPCSVTVGFQDLIPCIAYLPLSYPPSPSHTVPPHPPIVCNSQ